MYVVDHIIMLLWEHILKNCLIGALETRHVWIYLNRYQTHPVAIPTIEVKMSSTFWDATMVMSEIPKLNNTFSRR